MITKEDEKFMAYWQKNRLKEKSLYKQLSYGLPIGMLFGIGILLNFITGWYSRANMVANSQSTPLVLLIAIALIAIFCGIFFKRHQWEMNEQRFVELTMEKERQESSTEMQQN